MIVGGGIQNLIYMLKSKATKHKTLMNVFLFTTVILGAISLSYYLKGSQNANKDKLRKKYS